MGAAQSAGGAATSGAQISGKELTWAIREAAKQDVKAAAGIRTDSEATAEELQPAAPFSFEYGMGDEKRTMTVTSYAPTVFARIRRIEGVTDEHFLSEWTLPDDKCQTALGEGRSMAMFLKSASLDFMCKTIAEVEVTVLNSILADYLTHLRTHPDSLLMRFLMLLRIEANNDVGFLLVFSDSFAHAAKLNERWDIKGRVPKPGKFRHFPPRAAEDLDLEGSGITDADRAAEPGTPGGAASTRFSDGEDHPPASPLSRSIPTKKDKELTRLFWLEADERDALLRDLNCDFDFLSGHGLMDYSILVGVKYTADFAELPVRQDSHLPNLAATPSTLTGSPTGVGAPLPRQNTAEGPTPTSQQSVPLTPPPPAAEVRPMRAIGAGDTGTSRYHRGLPAMLGEEVYFIAIIDMLTLYNGKKMSANFFKGFLWQPTTLSTIPPPAYRQRISTYADLIFASPDDDLTDVKARHAAAS